MPLRAAARTSVCAVHAFRCSLVATIPRALFHIFANAVALPLTLPPPSPLSSSLMISNSFLGVSNIRAVVIDSASVRGHIETWSECVCDCIRIDKTLLEMARNGI